MLNKSSLFVSITLLILKQMPVSDIDKLSDAQIEQFWRRVNPVEGQSSNRGRRYGAMVTCNGYC
jgi:hypothetical protein